MFAVVSNNRFTGAVYAELTELVLNHHTQYGQTFVVIDSPLKDQATPAVPETTPEVKDEEGNVIHPSETIFVPHTPDYGEVTVEQKTAFVRYQRDSLLGQTDWTQTLDSSLNVEKQQEFKAYRQMLKDIPQAYQNPDDVVWPEKPKL